MVRLNADEKSEKVDLLNAIDVISSAENFKVRNLIRGPILVIEYVPRVLPEDRDYAEYLKIVRQLTDIPGVRLFCDSLGGPVTRMTGSN